MVAHGANLGVADQQGDSAVYWAARQGHAPVIRFLIIMMMIVMMIGGYHDADGDDRCVLGDPVIGIIIIIMEKKMRWILERGDNDMNIRLFCS